MSTSLPSVADRYRRVDEFEARAEQLRLRPIEWRLALALDGHRTLGGIAQSLGIPPTEAVEIVAHFESIGLAETPRVSLQEYRAPAKPEAFVPAPSPRPPVPPPPPMAPMPPIEPVRPAPEAAAVTENGAPETAAPRISFSLRSRPPEPPAAED
jgi:hypothetical protein